MMEDKYQWRRLDEFIIGDKIHRWGDNLEVTEVGFCYLYYRDTDGEEKILRDMPNSEYLSLKRLTGYDRRGKI